jgi:hypothetical protein
MVFVMDSSALQRLLHRARTGKEQASLLREAKDYVQILDALPGHPFTQIVGRGKDNYL